MLNKNIVIYCDGACSGNPGPGGWGSIVGYNNQVLELGGGDPQTTNNRMELTGAIEALRFCLSQNATMKNKSILVFTDSVYVIKGITQWIFGWKRRGWKNAENQEVSNQELWIKLDQVVNQLKAKGYELTWSFVKGHAGIEGNERCDVIAVAYSKDDYIDLYKGSSEEYRFDINTMPVTRPLPEFKNKNTTEDKKNSWYLSYVNGVLTKHKTWPECEAVVKGRPAKFKKVSSEAEEAEVKKSWGIN